MFWSIQEVISTSLMVDNTCGSTIRDHYFFAGKPVAVTHSQGRGGQDNRPGSDLQYENSHLEERGLGGKVAVQVLHFNYRFFSYSTQNIKIVIYTIIE